MSPGDSHPVPQRYCNEPDQVGLKTFPAASHFFSKQEEEEEVYKLLRTYMFQTTGQIVMVGPTT